MALEPIIPTSSSAVEAAAPKKGSLLTWVAVGFLLAMSAGSTSYFAFPHPEKIKPTSRYADLLDEPTDPLTKVDLLLKVHDTEAALQAVKNQTKSLTTQEHGLLEPWVRREALAYEIAKNYPRALALYEKHGDPDGDAWLWAYHTLGQIRCEINLGAEKKAYQHLLALLLRSGDKQLQSLPLRSEIVMLTFMAGARTWNEGQPEPMKATYGWPTPVLDLGYILDWKQSPERAPAASLPLHVSHEEPSPPPNATDPEQLQVRQVEGKTLLSLNKGEENLLSFLKQLSNHFHGHWHLEAALESHLAQCTVTINIDQLPLEELSQALAWAYNIHLDPNNHNISSHPAEHNQTSPTGSENHQSLQGHTASANATETLLQYYVANRSPIMAHPQGWLARFFYITQAMKFKKLTPTKITQEFLEVAEAHPEGELAWLAQYNLALFKLQQEETVEARKYFLACADMARGSEKSYLCWWWMGRSYLDDKQLSSAIASFRQMLRSQEATTRRTAVMSLAFTRLLEERYEDAEATMFRYDRGRADRADPWWQYLDSLLKNQKKPSTIKAKEIAKKCQELDFLSAWGAAGLYWSGQCFRKADQPEMMQALYDQAHPYFRSPWLLEMQNELGHYCLHLGQYRLARKYFLVLVAFPEHKYTSQALLALAQINLAEGKPRECLQHCHAYLAKNKNIAPCLVLMGKAYEQVADHRRAAECFAGRIPPQ